MKKIIDAFLFFNEFNLLKLRLGYLNDVVDHFIICECNHTHSSIPKPYYFDEIINDIPENIRKKIIRVKYEVDGRYYYNDSWRLENEQRDFIGKNLSQFSPNDLIMISDVDEIPRKKVVKDIANISTIDDLFVAKCEFFYYNFTTFLNNDWKGTTFSSVQKCIEKGSHSLRLIDDQNIELYKLIENGGWHFSYFCDPEKIKHKIESFAHSEFNLDSYKNEENISDAITNKRDIYNKQTFFTEYNFDNYPEDIKQLIINFFPKEYFSEN